MCMAAIDWTKIYKKYKGLWVAIKTPDEPTVVASGKTLKDTIQKAHSKGFKQPFVTQIPKKVLPIVGVI